MSDISIGGMISAPQVQKAVGNTGFDMKGAYREYYAEMMKMLNDYADPTKDMVIAGHLIKAKDKYGQAATMLFNYESDQLTQRQSTFLAIWTSLFQLEKSVGGTSG